MKINIFGKQIEMKKEAVVISASIIALLSCLLGYIFFSDDSDIIIEENPTALGEESKDFASEGESPLENNELDDNEQIKEEKEYIKIYVVGSVNKPGIVTIEKGQMLYDAVEKAGGLTKEADPNSINMVYELNENIMVYIKSIKETQDKSIDDNPPTVKEVTKDANVGNGAAIFKDSGSSTQLLGISSGNNNKESSDGTSLVNLNTAGADELDTLPGVGEATAKAIIDFRDKHGPFTKIEDIMKVPRIKQGRFDSIKDFITVE